MAKRKKTGHKIGATYITFRMIDGKRKKVSVKRLGKDKESVHVLGAKKKAGRKKRRK